MTDRQQRDGPDAPAVLVRRGRIKFLQRAFGREHTRGAVD